MPPSHGTAEHDPTSDLLDADGRPVGEIGSRRYEPDLTEIVACPYADARRGGPMNHTALRQLSSVWPEVLGAASALAGPTASVHQAWRACIAGTRAPALLGAPVPRVWSALYKASLGFSQVLTALLLSEDGMADVPLGSLGDADAFLALLDRERWLVGAEQVCAGPAPMIGQMFTALCGGHAPQLPADAPTGQTWIDERTDWIGVQVAFLGASRDAALRDGIAPEARAGTLTAGIPCLRSVLARPGRRADHAQRLFSGPVPAMTRAFLDALPRPFDALPTLRDRVLSAGASPR